MRCPDCEDGLCCCSSGCPDCLGTRTCSTCHGLMMLEPPRIDRKNWCTTCNRSTRRRREQPDYSHLRDTQPGKYTKMMSMERCKDCHAPFQTSGARPYGYRLQEIAS